jgi:hypothetical protein
MDEGVLAALLGRLERHDRELSDVQRVLNELVTSWVQNADQRMQRLRNDIDSLLTGVAPAIPKSPEAVPSAVSGSKGLRGPHNKFPKTYEEYRQVLDMKEAGVSIKRTGKVLGIPYSTVHSYLNLTEDAVTELRRKSEAADRLGYTTLARRRRPYPQSSTGPAGPESSG